MEPFAITVSVVGALFCVALLIAVLLNRCRACGRGAGAPNTAVYNLIKIDLEAETRATVKHKTLSLFLTYSNSAYTVNVLCATLVGITLGFDSSREDPSTLPNLFNLGLIVVLMSPGNQGDATQVRDFCCCNSVPKSVRDYFHELGFLLFFVGVCGGGVLHSLLLTHCFDAQYVSHDRVFAGLFFLDTALLAIFTAVFLLDEFAYIQCNADAMYWLEVVSLVGGLSVHFGHSVWSFTLPDRPCTYFEANETVIVGVSGALALACFLLHPAYALCCLLFVKFQQKCCPQKPDGATGAVIT